MNGITYFRLKSDYDGDVTKDCGLTGQEIDNNFYVLEGRDVKSLEVDGDDITIVLYNGDRITAEDALSGYAKDLSFDFDEKSGTLTITQNGEETVIEGFGCANCGVVYTDSTLVGDGTKENPLGVSPMEQTGHYKPVITIIDGVGDDGKLPTNPNKGDRYVIKNEVSSYGFLYDYHAVARIACLLNGTGWRIPTKADWDEMLNEIDEVKNHDSWAEAVYLGKYAGKMLKSPTVEEDECGWQECDDDCRPGGDGCGCGCNGQDTSGTTDGCDSTNPCMPMDCHHEQSTPSNITPETTDGIDCYGFSVEPTGWGNDGKHVYYFGEEARYWTADIDESHKNAWIKGFNNCHNGVYQDKVPVTNFMSLRLVKDYDGNNYFGTEAIGDQVVETVFMPGGKVWTKTNIAINVCPCDGGCKCHQVKPNINEECDEVSTNYVIAEWDGFQWVYKVISEGEIVTTLDDYNDYKVVNGELVKNNENVEAELSELEQRVTTIEGQITTIVTTVENVQTTVNELETTVQNHTQLITNITSDVTDLTSRVEANEQNITTLTGKVDTLESDMAQVKSDIQTLNGDVAEIRGFIGEYTAEMQTISERLGRIENLLKNGLIDFNDRNANEDLTDDTIYVNGQPW